MIKGLVAALVMFVGVAFGANTAQSDGIDDSDRGNASFDAGDFEQAIHWWGRAIQSGDLDPHQLVEVFFNLGLANDRLGRFETAMENYRDAIRLDPQHLQSISSICFDLYQLGRPQEALGYCNQALSINPKDGPTHGIRAGVWELLGNEELAIEDHRTAVRFDPENWIGYYNMARTLDFFGREAEAGEVLAEALKRAPDWLFQHQRSQHLLKKYGFIQ